VNSKNYVVGATVSSPVLDSDAQRNDTTLIIGASYDVAALTLATALAVFKHPPGLSYDRLYVSPMTATIPAPERNGGVGIRQRPGQASDGYSAATPPDRAASAPRLTSSATISATLAATPSSARVAISAGSDFGPLMPFVMSVSM
jgi:hypothetical protein